MRTAIRRIAGTVWLASISVTALAQPLGVKPAPPAFEAASVKVTAPADGLPGRPRISGGPGSSDPGRIDYQSMTLGSVVQRAYDLPFYRLSAPAWFNTERHDIHATIPEGATEEQFRQMLQNLLAERFKLVAHREAREMLVDELTVARGGPKFKARSARRSSASAGRGSRPRSLHGATGAARLKAGVEESSGGDAGGGSCGEDTGGELTSHQFQCRFKIGEWRFPARTIRLTTQPPRVRFRRLRGRLRPIPGSRGIRAS
jgi:uncharacterized protein (TIGR03435 family)